ncbi:MAG TPA: four helix bundle protein [Candidatus Binatia bacterium]|nr:four helix bundle protein [Candidatus Binatia bacterium]
MKEDSNAKDEKMRAENGRIKGDLKERTKEFALNIIALYSQLPKRREAQVLGDQLLRSGTSVGARSSELDMRKVLLSSSRQTLVRPLLDR